MSVIIRLQNLPWSANALDIRNFFRGLSIPEGGVHIVGGELGDAFIAFSTDEDARQAMMLDGGKVKEIQVKLLLSSRSEMHKVIEAARQNVPLLSLAAPVVTTAAVAVAAPAPATITVPQPLVPALTPFSAALGNNPLSSFGIPGIGNPQEIPQPAVIEPPAPLVSPTAIITTVDDDRDDELSDRRRSREKDRRRTRSRSRSRDRDRKDRKRRDRSRSRDRRRRDRSRSRDRRDRKRKDRSRSRDRSPSRRSRDRRNDRFAGSHENSVDIQDMPNAPTPPNFPNMNQNPAPQMQPLYQNNAMQNGPMGRNDAPINRFNDPSISETFNKLQELGKKRNPHAFQGEQIGNGGGRMQNIPRGGMGPRGGGNMRRERPSRFENEPQRDCCVAIRNAPNHTSYGDVRRFFPFMIDKHGIKMINDNTGRRTGNIYVRFCEARSKQLALQRKHSELKGAEVIVEALDDSAYESAVDSFLPYRDNNDGDDHIISISDPEPKNQSPLTVIKMSELPNFVKEHDIIKSFSDFSLLSIMLNDCRITRTKTAYVQFVKPEDAKLALERKDRYIFGRRTATVTGISVAEYESEKIAQNDKTQELEAPQEQFEPPVETPQEVAAPRDPRQRRQQANNGPVNGGNDVLQTQPQVAPFFSPPFAQQQVFPGQFPGPQFGGFPGPGGAPMDPRTAASNWANRPQFQSQMDQVPNPNLNSKDLDNEPLDCILMKGLPRDATDKTIVTFLSDTGAVPARIHLMLDTFGLPSGDCFCEFRSTPEARMAHTKHGKNLDGCRVTIDLVPRSVVDEALEGPKQPQDGILGSGPPPLQMPVQFPSFDSNIRGGGAGSGGFQGAFRGRGGFDRGGFDRGGFSRGSGYEGRGGFRGRGNFDRSRGFDRGRGRGRGFGRPGFNDNRRNEEEQDPALDDFGAPGCVVSMENVPFRASIDDIMDFFSEFELTQDDVIRRYNERGQPTGDARVAFRTPFDAQRAVKTRHMDMIHERRISLCVL